MKKLREKLGYKSKDFAMKLGIAPNVYSMLENGKRVITLEREKRIMEAIGFWSDGERVDMQVHIDYLKVTFFQAEVEDIMTKVLGIGTEYFLKEESKQNNYQYLHWCGSIILKSRDDDIQGVLLELTGEGVVQFRRHLEEQGLDLHEWLRKVFGESGFLADGVYTRAHSTRLDIAINEMYNPIGGNFDLKRLKKKKEEGMYSSSLKAKKEILSSTDEEGEDGLTLNFGAKGSEAVSIRLYEKRFELAKKLKLDVQTVLTEHGLWNRFELELGKIATPAVFDRLFNGELLEDIAIDLLHTKIAFYEMGDTHMGKEMQAFKEWYDLFGKWNTFKISYPKKEVSLERSMRWIETQVAPTLEMVRRIFGEEWLFKWLLYCMDKVELNPKKENRIEVEMEILDAMDNGVYLYYNKKMEEQEGEEEGEKLKLLD